jgi:hypothetical protein
MAALAHGQPPAGDLHTAELCPGNSSCPPVGNISALAHFPSSDLPGVSGGVMIMMFVIMPGVRS